LAVELGSQNINVFETLREGKDLILKFGVDVEGFQKALAVAKLIPEWFKETRKKGLGIDKIRTYIMKAVEAFSNIEILEMLLRAEMKSAGSRVRSRTIRDNEVIRSEVSEVRVEGPASEKAIGRMFGLTNVMIIEEKEIDSRTCPDTRETVWKIVDVIFEGEPLSYALPLIDEKELGYISTLPLDVAKERLALALSSKSSSPISRGLTPEDQAPIEAALALAFAQDRVKEPDSKMRDMLVQAIQRLRNSEKNELAMFIAESDFRFVMPESDLNSHAPPQYLWYASDEKFLLAAVHRYQGNKLVLLPYSLVELLLNQKATELLIEILIHEARHIHSAFRSDTEHDQDTRQIVSRVIFSIASEAAVELSKLLTAPNIQHASDQLNKAVYEDQFTLAAVTLCNLITS
jgi:hypothetical protein